MRSVAATVLIATLTLAAPFAHASERRRIRNVNIGSQAVVTVVSGLIQGKIHSVRDLMTCLGAGAAAGYGFYEAKVRVGRGDTQSGWLLANVAASISENAAAGRHPLSQLGYSIGPLRLRVPIPRFDPTADSYAYVDASAYETGALIRAWRDGDRMRWRSGMIAFERDTVYPADDDGGPWAGVTYGMYPGVWRGAPYVWPHEVIHAIQSLQAESAEPALRIFTYTPRRTDRKRAIRFERFKPGAVNLLNDSILANQNYSARWSEIEAYRLADDQEP
jgi:hypothetical protein